MITRHTITRADGSRVTLPHLLASHAQSLAAAARLRVTLPIMARDYAKYARALRLHNTVAYRPRLP